MSHNDEHILPGVLRSGGHPLKNTNLRSEGGATTIWLSDHAISQIIATEPQGGRFIIEHYSPDNRLTTFFLGRKLEKQERGRHGYKGDDYRCHFLVWIVDVAIKSAEDGEQLRVLIKKENVHNAKVDERVFGEMKDRLAKYQRAETQRRLGLIIKSVVNPPGAVVDILVGQ